MRIAACIAALATLALSLMPLGAAEAASRITTKDGNVIVGDVESLKDNVYTIKTPYGPMRVPAESVDRIEPAETAAAPAPASRGPGAAPPGAAPPEAGASAAAPAPSGALRLAGSNTIGAELAPRLLEAYAKKNGSGDIEWRGEGEDRSLIAHGQGGDFTADVSSHGSGTAPVQIAAGKADIGMMSRPINAKEVATLTQVGFGKADSPGQEHVVALDGLVVLVNKDNPVKQLSLADIQGLFSGAIADWSQVGGKPGPVHVYARDDKSGTYDTFKALVLKDKKLIGSAKRYEDSKELSDDVANDENGIGFVGFAYVRNARALAIGTECGLAFEPKEYAVKTEEYPLARRLFLYTPQKATNPHGGPFVEYALSSAAQPVVSREGFVSLLPESSDQDYVGQRIQQAAQNQEDSDAAARQFTRLTRAIAKGDRLSLTYRFQTNSDALDSRAVRDIARLAEYLDKPENRGRKLMLAGFSDSRGSFARNLALSRNRAQAIAAELRKNGVKPASVEGFGPVAPVACNDSDEGLSKNRRVEVWLQ